LSILPIRGGPLFLKNRKRKKKALPKGEEEKRNRKNMETMRERAEGVPKEGEKKRTKRKGKIFSKGRHFDWSQKGGP